MQIFVSSYHQNQQHRQHQLHLVHLYHQLLQQFLQVTNHTHADVRQLIHQQLMTALHATVQSHPALLILFYLSTLQMPLYCTVNVTITLLSMINHCTANHKAALQTLSAGQATNNHWRKATTILLVNTDYFNIHQHSSSSEEALSPSLVLVLGTLEMKYQDNDDNHHHYYNDVEQSHAVSDFVLDIHGRRPRTTCLQ